MFFSFIITKIIAVTSISENLCIRLLFECLHKVMTAIKVWLLTSTVVKLSTKSKNSSYFKLKYKFKKILKHQN